MHKNRASSADMDTEAFIRWALDSRRTIDERYTTELLVEEAVWSWQAKHNIYPRFNWEAKRELDRQRKLNPAYQPVYSEESLRRTAEMLPAKKEYSVRYYSYDSRPVRDLSVLRFLPWLEKIEFSGELQDCSIFTEFPALHTLSFYSAICEDYRPLAHCAALKSLNLTLSTHWPEVGGLETLRQLETFNIGGNLLVFPRGCVFPGVRQGSISCSPLHARNVRDLPQFPACEFLTLSGVERLDGIEAFPLLRNITLTGPVRDFAPLAALEALTCLTYTGDRPLDVAPLARVPRLHYAAFNTSHTYGIDKAPLRDFAPLAASPTLRELVLTGCPPLELEVAAINAMLPPCDDLWLLEKPRPYPRHLRMVVAPRSVFPVQRPHPYRAPEDPDLIDTGLRKCEGRWVQKYAQQRINQRIGHSDWGHTEANGESRNVSATIECFEVVDRVPEIVETLREILAILRVEYTAGIHVWLKVPPPKLTEAQKQLMEQFRDEQDKAEYERRRHDELEALERKYLYELKKQEGGEINPEEFAAPAPLPLPPAPWERESDDDDDDSSFNVATKHKPEPPPDLWDNEHPLADNYNLIAEVTPDSIYFYPHARTIAVHLMHREPDVDIPEEKEKG